MREEILKALKKASDNQNVKLELSENEAFGDYSSNIALQDKRQEVKDKSSRELAENLVKKLKADKNLSEICDKVDIAGPGFINFWLKKDVLVDTLKQIDTSKSNFGKSDIGRGKTVIIDYSSPNIAKPFGIGHLRSTIVGQALYNLYLALGYEVVGDNHLGDWGTQFGKLIYMIKKENIDNFDIEKLEKLYVEFHRLASDPKNADQMESSAREWFKKLEDGDSEARKIWQKCVDVSLAEFERVYKILGVKIDFAFGESYYESEMKQMLGDSSIQKHLEEGDDGAKIINLAGIKTPLMFIKSDGATTYATRDLAAIKFRMRKWDPAIIIYEVGAEQTLHFQQVFAAARLLGLVDDSTELVHTAHGLYLAPDGKKFSTRKGKTIKLEDVLNEAINRAEELGKKPNGSDYAKATAAIVGIGAIKYFDLMHSVKSDVVFDWDKMMNLEDNSGPYLQYTVARCNSVLAKSENWKIDDSLGIENWELKIEEESVLRSLIHFPEIIEEAADNFAPNLLCNYLHDLAGKYNHFYNSCPILNNSDQKVTNFRLTLTNGVAQVLKNGLGILGIETPERM